MSAPLAIEETDAVLNACAALRELVHCIENQQHARVQTQVDVLSAALRQLSSQQRLCGNLELTQLRRTALDEAMALGKTAFLQSVKTHVRAALARPLEGSIQFALP